MAFSYKDNEVRTVEVNGEFWFVAADVCNVLELTNTTIVLERLDDDEKSKFNLGLSGGATNCVNEYGLYNLVLASKKPEAKPFKRWITHEVLPSIRKTGKYEMYRLVEQDSYMIDDPAERARRWAEEYEQRCRLEKQNGILELENSEMKPKAKLYDEFIETATLVNFRDAAKEIGISQTQFTGWLKDNGYIYITSKNEVRPMETYMHSGLFKLKPYTNPYNGYSGTRTMITPRGLATFKLILMETGHTRFTMKKHGGRKAKIA